MRFLFCFERKFTEDFSLYIYHGTSLSLNDIGFHDDIVEDGNSFAENALIKCKAVYDYCKKNNYDYDIIELL